jgi:tRNA1(Val) A37 N6-methylase TrmN6
MIETTEDGFLGGRITLRQPARGYRAGVDPVLLAAAVNARAGQSVLELGTGVGTALICLGYRLPGLVLVGVELQEDLAALARENLSRNGLTGDVLTGDISSLPEALRQRTFDHVIANPPYFRGGDGSLSDNESRETGRRERTPLDVWIDVATRRLAPKGHLTVIQRAARLQNVLSALDGRIGSLSVTPISPRFGRKAELILVSGKKGGRGNLVLNAPFVMHEGVAHDGDRDSYTKAAKAILRDGAALTP